MAATKRNTNTLKRNRDLLCPWFDKIVANTDDAIQCPLLGIKFGLTLGTVVRHFSEFLRDRNYCQPPKQSKIQVKEPIKDVKVIFRTPGGMIQSYGMDNQLINELSGPETKELVYHNKLRSTDETIRHGFENLK